MFRIFGGQKWGKNDIQCIPLSQAAAGIDISWPCHRHILSAPDSDPQHAFQLDLVDIFTGCHFHYVTGYHILIGPLRNVTVLAGQLQLHVLLTANHLKKHDAIAVHIHLHSDCHVLAPLWCEIAPCASDASESLCLVPY